MNSSIRIFDEISARALRESLDCSLEFAFPDNFVIVISTPFSKVPRFIPLNFSCTDCFPLASLLIRAVGSVIAHSAAEIAPVSTRQCLQNAAFVSTYFKIINFPAPNAPYPRWTFIRIMRFPRPRGNAINQPGKRVSANRRKIRPG